MEIPTYIEGVKNGERQQHIANLKVGDKLKLKREPWNKFNSNAIKVYDAKENHLGYLPNEVASEIASWMDGGIVYGALVCSIKPMDYDGNLTAEILVRYLFDSNTL